MGEADPHIHVEQNVLEAGPTVRNLISSMLGRATDAPSVVTTGCGIQVPYAMTSPRPEASPASRVENTLTGSTCA